MSFKLKINSSQIAGSNCLGMSYLLNCLKDSELFEVSYHNENIHAMRNFAGTIIYFEDKKIYLDLWEYATPSHTDAAFYANFDLIIKVQHKDISLQTYNRYCDRKKPMLIDPSLREKWLEKFVPWTFFPSKMMDLLNFGRIITEKNKYPIERDCFFCGKNWKCRHKIIDSLKRQRIECEASDQGGEVGLKMSNEEFLHRMKTSKYGLVLAGRATPITDAKNRREIDYLMLGKPLLINYKPFYYNEFEAGKHYIYIDENTEIKSLDKMYNIEEIAKNGYEWYLQNATPEAIPKTFVQIMQEKLT